MWNNRSRTLRKACLLLLLAAAPLCAQKPPEKTPFEQEKEILKLRLEIATLKADLARSMAATGTAQSNAQKAKFPLGIVNPLSGTMKVTGDNALPLEILVYSTSDKLIAKNCVEIKNSLSRVPDLRDRGIIIYSQARADALPALRTRYLRFDRRLDTLAEKAAAAAHSVETEGAKIKAIGSGPEIAEAIAHLTLAKRLLDEESAPALSGEPASGSAPGGEPVSSSSSASAYSPGLDLSSLSVVRDNVNAVNSTVQTVIQLAQLFRTDTAITSTTIKINPAVLAAQYSEHLSNPVRASAAKPGKNKNPAPVSPPPPATVRTYSIDLLPVSNSGLLRKIDRVTASQGNIQAGIESLDVFSDGLDQWTAKIDRLIKESVSNGQFQPGNVDPAKLVARAQLANAAKLAFIREYLARLYSLASEADTSVSDFFEKIHLPDAETAVTPLQEVLQSEAFVKKCSDGRTFHLVVDIICSGGNTRIDRNVFGSWLRQLGGAVITTNLHNPDGTLRYSRVSKGYLGYVPTKNRGGVVANDLAVKN